MSIGEQKGAGPKLKEIANIAMEKAKQFELEHGRNPELVTDQRAKGYDLSSGDRKIEVKGTAWMWEKQKKSFTYISENEFRNASHLYVVCDVYGKPDLHVFEFAKLPFKAIKVEVKYVLSFPQCRDLESPETLIPQH